jgi:hypothetical protein
MIIAAVKEGGIVVWLCLVAFHPLNDMSSRHYVQIYPTMSIIKVYSI